MKTTTFRASARFALILIACTFALTSLWQARAQELKQVFDPPLVGTFYLLSFQLAEVQSPPHPIDPYGGTLPTYQIEGFPNSYLVADTAEDYLALRSKAADGYGEMDAVGGEGGGGFEFSMGVYGSNDLWLEIVAVTNGLANFIIHTPDTDAYDVFATTNLNTNVPGLNGTNWVWLWRTGVGETNVALTNLWLDMGFFILGTMQDSDADSLTDAYELLVSHTNPANWDTDGDTLSDGWEVEHGMDPNLDESAQTSGRMNYQYDGSGWLRTVSGHKSEGITLDDEGNVQTAQ